MCPHVFSELAGLQEVAGADGAGVAFSVDPLVIPQAADGAESLCAGGTAVRCLRGVDLKVVFEFRRLREALSTDAAAVELLRAAGIVSSITVVLHDLHLYPQQPVKTAVQRRTRGHAAFTAWLLWFLLVFDLHGPVVCRHRGALSLLLVELQVFLEHALCRESLHADVTLKRSLSGVDPPVVSQPRRSAETAAADFAHEGRHYQVELLVLLQVLMGREIFTTLEAAVKRTLAVLLTRRFHQLPLLLVSPQVFLQQPRPVEALFTKGAGVEPGS